MSNELTIDALIKDLEELQLQEAAIIRLIKNLREREEREIQAEHRTPAPITVGSRVRILNKPTKWNLGSPVSAKDRLATVTKITDRRVYIKTDNGVVTWRDRRNLETL
jgi:hypothetical protein